MAEKIAVGIIVALASIVFTLIVTGKTKNHSSPCERLLSVAERLNTIDINSGRILDLEVESARSEANYLHIIKTLDQLAQEIKELRADTLANHQLLLNRKRSV